MAEDRSNDAQAEIIDKDEPSSESAALGPWPKEKNRLLAASLAGIALTMLITTVALVMLIRYDLIVASLLANL